MRRKEREITDRTEIDRIINSCLVCRVAFAVANEPYVVPLSFGYDGRALYFHTAKSGKKIDCIESNSRVCFEFDCNVKLRKNDEIACQWSVDFESVIGYGAIAEVISLDEKTAGLNAIMLQYSGKEWEMGQPQIKATRVWRLTIDSMTGKRSVEKNV